MILLTTKLIFLTMKLLQTPPSIIMFGKVSFDLSFIYFLSVSLINHWKPCWNIHVHVTDFCPALIHCTCIWQNYLGGNVDNSFEGWHNWMFRELPGNTDQPPRLLTCIKLPFEAWHEKCSNWCHCVMFKCLISTF